MSTDERNLEVFERDANYYLTWELQPAEQALLRRFKGRWAQMDMLDLGVGAGRTAYTFSALTRRYIGVDYSRRMVEVCRQRLGESESVRFALADARDLSMFDGQQFDLILFSYNGIDCVDHEDRGRVLREVRKLLKDDGYFFFSAHSLLAFPFRTQLRRTRVRDPLRWAHQFCRSLVRSLRLTLINRQYDADELRKRGWAILKDGSHGFALSVHYVMPEVQVAQLRDLGFEVVGLYDRTGAAVDVRSPGHGEWLFYLCLPAAGRSVSHPTPTGDGFVMTQSGDIADDEPARA